MNVEIVEEVEKEDQEAMIEEDAPRKLNSLLF